MKRMKKMMATMVLIAVATMGTPQAFAGIMLGDAARGTCQQDGIMLGDRVGGTCQNGITLNDIAGITLNDFAGITLND